MKDITRVRVTDLLTSAKHFKLPKNNYLGFDLDKEDGYTYVELDYEDE